MSDFNAIMEKLESMEKAQQLQNDHINNRLDAIVIDVKNIKEAVGRIDEGNPLDILTLLKNTSASHKLLSLDIDFITNKVSQLEKELNRLRNH